MPTFIHAADLHLDSPLRGLDRYDGAPVEEIRGATRRAVENLVGLAISQSVDFLLIAGDIYDGDWRDYNTGLFFLAQMSRFAALSIAPVAVVSPLQRSGAIFTLGLSWAGNRKLEEITWRVVLGIFISVGGAVLLILARFG